jgi:hypothetical protein
MGNALKTWQPALDGMAQAVELAPENIFVRARRGVVLISVSRATPPEMAKPLLEPIRGGLRASRIAASSAASLWKLTTCFTIAP